MMMGMNMSQEKIVSQIVEDLASVLPSNGMEEIATFFLKRIRMIWNKIINVKAHRAMPL